jgi:hypothetical protein
VEETKCRLLRSHKVLLNIASGVMFVLACKISTQGLQRASSYIPKEGKGGTKTTHV